MKYEWRKQEKDIYMTKTTPNLHTIPTQQFLVIQGNDNPNLLAKLDLYTHYHTH